MYNIICAPTTNLTLLVKFAVSTKQSRLSRVQRFRQRNTRIDYYPSNDVANLLAYHEAASEGMTVGEVINALVRAGHKVVSGSAVGINPHNHTRRAAGSRLDHP